MPLLGLRMKQACDFGSTQDFMFLMFCFGGWMYLFGFLFLYFIYHWYVFGAEVVHQHMNLWNHVD